MSIHITAAFGDDEIESIDRLVDQEVAPTRSDVIRFAVLLLDDAVQRVDEGQAIADSYRRKPQSAADVIWAQANADALVESEPW